MDNNNNALFYSKEAHKYAIEFLLNLENSSEVDKSATKSGGKLKQEVKKPIEMPITQPVPSPSQKC